MPKIHVNVPHNQDPEAVVEKVKAAIDKTVTDFQGHDFHADWSGRSASFHFKSMAFTIKGTIDVQPEQVAVEVDLPIAAMMFKDRAEKAIAKNLSQAIES